MTEGEGTVAPGYGLARVGWVVPASSGHVSA
jgi:hypothetical protein